MFSKLTALVAEVVGLGPQHSSRPAEDFSAHWRAITDCISSDDTIESVSVTEIPSHLEAMVELLCLEDSQKDSRDQGTMGPCLEFMLRHRILNTLYTPSKNDYPSGIRHEVLIFLIHVLARMEQPLLPHVSVHQPVQRQIQLCGLHPQSPLALKEIQFLRTLCLKVHSDSRLADFLLAELPIKRSPLAPPSPSSSSSLSTSPTISNSPSPPSSSSAGTAAKKTVYLVAEALQRLVNHNDNLVAMKAYECLLNCVSLHHEGVARVLASSQLPVLLASKLQYHFQLIPLSCPHTAIVGCNTGWGVDYATRSSTADHSPSTYGLWHVEAYLSWLDYMEQAVVSASSPLYQALCAAVQELLLEASLLPRILKQTEEDILLGTAVLARSIHFISDESLLSEFVLCVLGRGGGNSSSSSKGGVVVVNSGDGAGGKEPVETLRQLIVQRIDHPSDDVCQATLHLIDVLLQCPLASVFLRELVFSGSPATTTPDSSHPAPLSQTPHTPNNSFLSPRTPQSALGHGSSSLALQRKKLEESVSSYLSLVPAELLSAELVTGDTGIEDYLIDAHQQVLKCWVLTQLWSDSGDDRAPKGVWSSPDSVPPDTVESPLPKRGEGGGGVTLEGEAGGKMGPLVPALLSKLERLLDQSYEVNLLLTSVLSRLAAFSHPLIDHLFSPDTSSQTSVFSVLKKVSGELVVHAERSPGFQFHLREVRKRMVGQETSDLLSMPHNDLLEGAIVLEELCKEVSCLLFAKHSAALLALPPCGLPSPISPTTT